MAIANPPPMDKKQTDALSRIKRVYHLTGYGELAVAIDQMLDCEGIRVEQLENVSELSELLQTQPADLVLVDAEFANIAQTVLAALAPYRNLEQGTLPLLQICAQETLAKELNAAGIDAVVVTDKNAQGVADKIRRLLPPANTDRYRVLIIEDDRSQAIFAEGILRNAGIDSRTELDTQNLMSSIRDYDPDLILMDLNMPNASGIQLTEMIRESASYQNIPIIFLSGESDEDRQIDAMEAGGDDFLRKPIMPRRLVAAIKNRIKRHRALSAIMAKPEPASFPALMPQKELLRALHDNIQSSDHALFVIELNSTSLLRDRIGLSGLELLLESLAQELVRHCKPYPVARIAEGSFAMLYQGDCAEEALSAFAKMVRTQIMALKFEANSQPVELRIYIGICQIQGGPENPDILINAAARTARSAFNHKEGIAIYKSKAESEVTRENAILERLANLTENNCLSHVYQPIVAVAGGTEKQYQTLLRFTDAQGQVVPAVEFISLAERSNLVIELDRWSMAQAISTVTKYKADQDEIMFFVNQSITSIINGEYLTWLKNQLKAFALQDNTLVIEIDHNDALLNQQAVLAFCQALVGDGVKFCLSRYIPRNDLPNLLADLPLSYVKLSQELSADLSTQKTRDEIKKAVDSAHRLGLYVIVHSVEDAQSAATLWMSGIDFIQGNLVQSATTRLDFGFDFLKLQ